jgi:hypothetical protein
MSANYPPPPPPQQPGGNPFAQQPPPSPYGQPPQQPYGAMQQPYGAPQQPYGAPQQPFNAAAYPPPAALAPRRENVALGIVVGIAAALAGALLYGLLIKGTKHEIGYAALGVGALVGFALGKVGGRNPVLPVLGIPLALFAVYAGQLFGIALIASSQGDMGVIDIFTKHFGLLQHAWKDSMDAMDFFFFAIAGAEGFAIAKRVAN